MSRGKGKYRVGLDDRPLTKDEFARLRDGGSLYCRIVASSKHLRRRESTRLSKDISKRKANELLELI